MADTIPRVTLMLSPRSRGKPSAITSSPSRTRAVKHDCDARLSFHYVLIGKYVPVGIDYEAGAPAVSA